MLVVVIAMVGFGVDVGYVMLVKTQLQVAADSAAMAAAANMGGTSSDIITQAQDFGGRHVAGGKSVALANSDVEFGTWDATSRTFTSSAAVGNAVRVTARRNNTTGGNTYFWGRVFGLQTFTTQASAIAMGNPRDIAFVVDLSGSMNDDSEPCWATNEITSEFGPQGYPTVGTDMIQTLFTQFNYGSYPGTLQYIGAPASIAANNRAYAQLTKNSGPLTPASVNASYRILSSDNETTRKLKGYRWIIMNQILPLMPNARPTPNITTNYAYWERYLDYIMEAVTVNSGNGTPPSNRGSLPPNKWSLAIDNLNNPNNTSYPSASVSVPQGYRNKIGYLTYVQFMMDCGRDYRPDGVNYTPLSVSSPYCPYHNEVTAGGTFSFPPNEQPTHSARRSIIAALQEIKSKNNTIPDSSQRDWVSIVTFDTTTGVTLKQSLTSNYDTAMSIVRNVQAVGDTQNSTHTESGLILARQHIASTASGGLGRQNTQKVVVLLTDGMPNLYTSSTATINSFRASNPSSNWYAGSNYPADGALMQIMGMQQSGWHTFPVGLGLGTDYSFMDRAARMGSTANDDGESRRTSGNPLAYEQELSEIFQQIIDNPQVRLVQ